MIGLVPLQPEELASTDPSKSGAVRLRDPSSGTRIELNYDPPGSPYAVPYTEGAELDHLAFRVDHLDRTLERRNAPGLPAQKMPPDDGPGLATPPYRMAYVRDPDGIVLELWEAPGPSEFDPNTY